MLQKVIAVKNVGRLTNCAATGDVEFRRLTLIYGLNGRGKTTLCDVLRSLSEGNSSIIAGRRTLGSAEPPSVHLLTDTGTVQFRNGNWTGARPRLAIFDTTFIHNNVCTNTVEIGQRRNLYHVIIGEQGVTLARTVEQLDGRIREINAQIAERRQGVTAIAPSGVPFDQFLSFPLDADVAERIIAKEREVAAAANIGAIRDRQGLTPLALPSLPDDFAATLRTTVEGISESAARQVREHLQKRTRNGEAWVAQGLTQCVSDACPFCGQSLAGVALIEAFRRFFDRSYTQLKERVNGLDVSVGLLNRTRTRDALARCVDRNTAAIEFWRQYIDAELLPLDVDEVVDAMNDVASAAGALVTTKKASLLEPLALSPAFDAAVQRLARLQDAVAAYNERVVAVNERIQAKKTSVSVDDVPRLSRELATLKAQQLRHEGRAVTACARYQESISQKAELDRQKEAAKEALSTYAGRVFGQYQERINAWLKRCGTTFTIVDTRGNFVGGRPQSTYRLLINNVPVELGDGESPVSQTSFRNTLSGGDKATLALAFFLARLELDAAIDQTVVLFDDPFTSQDRGRRTCTYQTITKLATRAKQVIVLSHDPFFLRTIWDHVTQSTTKTLQLANVGQTCTLTEWDVEDCTRPEHEQNHRQLVQYRDYHEGDPRLVAKTIRLFVEGYLRCMFPNRFRADQWLGDFLQAIREAPADDPLASVQPQLQELGEINDYSKRYHHASNPNAEAEPIDEDELATFVARTLGLIGAI